MQTLSLDHLVNHLMKSETLEKIHFLLNLAIVQEFLADAKPIQSYLDQSSQETQLVLLAIIAIGEAPIVFRGWDHCEFLKDRLDSLAKMLMRVESFYDTIGGIVGYHTTVLKLAQSTNQEFIVNERFHKPPGIDISVDTPDLHESIRWGVEYLPQMAEIYPVGGAGDRLNLVDEKTGVPLPAAELVFGGHTLIEQLIRDLEAREYLYSKITGKELVTPIVLMTSHEKDNDRLIRQICESNKWFGRSEKNFFFVVQPLVPVITEEGHWVMQDTFDLYLKPGGHGVLWKLLEDQGAFDWLKTQGRSKALLRQINNPLAGIDYGLVAFTGIGCKFDKKFGFASCPREVNAAEGMNVLIEKQEGMEYVYGISNIEYTDFSKKGVKDQPKDEGSPFSQFPANTNLLFADLEEVRSLIPSCPVPGMLVNFKSRADFISADGKKESLPASRLESTMQNIADEIVYRTSKPLTNERISKLPTYLTYHERDKTICVTKRSYDSEKSLSETPEGCFYTIQSLYRDLLEDECQIKMPKFSSEEEYLKTGPTSLFLFHPSLGPLYSIIAQKIRRGCFSEGAELQIEVPEVDIEEIRLDGSLLILGSAAEGCCTLKNVAITNDGIDREQTDHYWKNTPVRKEAMEIILEGRSEFVAEGVEFKGALCVVVPDGYRFIVTELKGQIQIQKEVISVPTWSWKYEWDLNNKVAVSREPNTA